MKVKKVYLAYGSIAYDCTDVLGVYLSKEEAISALLAYKARMETCNDEDYEIITYDNYYVMEKDLGGECQRDETLGHNDTYV